MDWHTPATVEEYLDAQGTKQVTAINPTINITAEGMSEEVADDRYLAQSANLSDLADPAAAIEALNGDGDLAEFVNDHALGLVLSVNGQTGAVTISTASIGAVPTNDARLSDARTPTAHAASHADGGTDEITVAQSQVTGLAADLAGKAPLASPTLTGVPTAPTAPPGTDSTQIATTAFVLANAPSSSGFSTTFMLMGA